jgi:glycosyltransferase involved in cell wall biosynthesis
MQRTRVSVIVPIRNEERYIGTCLQSLLEQTYPKTLYEILVVDGRSSDQSKKIVEEFARTNEIVRCLDNPEAIAPAAMNIGIRSAAGEIIIRADGHNFYPKDYVANCVKYLAETGADNVGGPWRTVPSDGSFGAKVVVAILTNPFGVGDSRFRTSMFEGFVETVPFGAFRRELFDRVGLFDEKLVRNQDNELNARIRSAGGKIFQTPALSTEYHPVATVSALLKQTFRTSQWHAFSVRRNTSSMSVRHFVPALFVVSLVTLLSAAQRIHAALIALGILVAMYLLLGIYFALQRRRESDLLVTCVMPPACFLFHLAYGFGTIAGLRFILVAPSPSPIRAGKAINTG